MKKKGSMMLMMVIVGGIIVAGCERETNSQITRGEKSETEERSNQDVTCGDAGLASGPTEKELSKLDGLFGIWLGNRAKDYALQRKEINRTGAGEWFWTFQPSKGFLDFENYAFYITPKSEIVYGVEASKVFPTTEEGRCECINRLMKICKALELKFGIELEEKDDPACEYLYSIRGKSSSLGLALAQEKSLPLGITPDSASIAAQSVVELVVGFIRQDDRYLLVVMVRSDIGSVTARLESMQIQGEQQKKSEEKKAKDAALQASGLSSSDLDAL